MNTLPSFVTAPITVEDIAGDFASGVEPLDRFFHEHALGNDTRGIGKTFVLRRSPDDFELPPVIGFYTLSMADVEVAELPKQRARGLPKYPMPVALIGRLAVDARARGRGFGEALLVDAFQRVLAVADHVGCIGVIVDAKNKAALHFYERYAFVALGVADRFPRRMFLPIATMRASSADEGLTTRHT